MDRPIECPACGCTDYTDGDYSNYRGFACGVTWMPVSFDMRCALAWEAAVTARKEPVAQAKEKMLAAAAAWDAAKYAHKHCSYETYQDTMEAEGDAFDKLEEAIAAYFAAAQEPTP